MDNEVDLAIWDFAKDKGYTNVTKDRDFLQRSVLVGHPPKVIHLALGNCSVDELERVLVANISQMKIFGKHASKSYLLIQ